MAWNINNSAHTGLWATVRFDHRPTSKGVKFKDGGNWKLGFIIRSSAGASAQDVKQKSEAYANKIDGFLIGFFGAKYESESNQKKALTALEAAFSNTENTLSDLGDLVDLHYLMVGEIE
jgi:hypothetical protein